MTVVNFSSNSTLDTTRTDLITVRPKLLLDFSNSTVLDPRVTFTRSSGATRINARGLVETVGTNTPRIDYDPVTLACKGLLIEEQRTNSIFNNTMQGAVAGAPGTLPTNWSELIAGGLTRTITSVGVENGISYVEVRLAGTTTDTNSWNISFQLTTTVPAVSGQAWNFSSFLSLKAGALPGVLRIRTVERNSVGSYVGESNLDCGSLTDDLINNRFNVSRTMGVGTGYVSSNVYFVIASGAAVDVTFRIGLPQLELGAFATSVIPTTTTAVTRAADVAVIQGTSFSNWYNQSEGTLYAESSTLSTLTGAQSVALFKYPRLWQIEASSADSAVYWYGTQVELYVGGTYNNIGTVPLTINKLAVALSSIVDQSATSLNGAAAVIRSGALGGSATLIGLGNDGAGGAGSILNGHLSRIIYYNRRLSNTQIQQLTS